MKNWQASTLSREEMERFAAFSQGPSRTRERFSLKGADDLVFRDSLSVDEIHVNACDTLEDMLMSPILHHARQQHENICREATIQI
jgi:hypothetical protein